MKYFLRYPIAITILGAFLLLFIVSFLGQILLGATMVDLTERKLYTLSEGSQNIIAHIQEPITLSFFYSDSLSKGLPAMNQYASRVRKLLQHYQSDSDSKIQLEFVDPKPYSEAEDLVVSFGLKGMEVERGGNQFYFGLVATNKKGDQRVLPFFHLERERFLEYDISRMIYELNHPEKPKIGLISSFRLMSLGHPWVAMRHMEQVFEMVRIAPDEKTLPEDLDVLLVIQPQKLNKSLLYAMDQYVVSGKKALFFIDPFAEAAKPEKQIADKQMLSVLKKWGVFMDATHVVSDRQSSLYLYPYAERESSVAQMTHLSLDPQLMHRGDIATSLLRQVNIASAGWLDLAKESGLNMEPLLFSSKASMLIGVQQVKEGGNSREFLRRFTSEEKSLAMAARFTGYASSAFPKKAKKKGGLDMSEQEVQLVVVADSDLLRDGAWVDIQGYMGYQMINPFADNGAFVLNLMEHLAGSQDLISIRSRGTQARPFDVVEDLKRKAEARYLEQEATLKAQLAETESRLQALQKLKTESNESALEAEQEAEIARFKSDMRKIRKDLRKVQRELDRDIDALGQRLMWINILTMPIIVIIIAVFLSWYRRRVS